MIIKDKIRNAKTDRRPYVSGCHRLLSIMLYADNCVEDEKQIFAFCKAYANEFNRIDVEKLKK